MTTHYETMGVEKDATLEDIRVAYKRQRGDLHPDREGGDDAKMAALNAAHTVLKDPKLRAEYDATLPDVERDALQSVTSAFSTFIAREDDPLAAATAGLEEKRAQVLMYQEGAERAIKNLRKHMAKLKRKGGGENLAQRLMQKQIESHEVNIEGLNHAEKVLDRALEMLDDYEYEQPPMPPTTMPMSEAMKLMVGMNWGGMGSIGS